MALQIINSSESLLDYRQQWATLAQSALEKNVFFEPAILLPALKHFSPKEIFFLLIWSNENSKSKLIGFFPLIRQFSYRHIPVPYVSIWKHSHCFLTTPLVHKNYCAECLQTFFEWLDNPNERTKLLSLDGFYGRGPFYESLLNIITTEGYSREEMGSYKRSYLRCDSSSQTYFKTAFKEKSLNRLLKKKRTFEKQGNLTFQVFNREKDNICSWVDLFLALEESGWKGEEGSAMACNEEERTYFNEVIKNASDNSQLLMSRLSLNDEAAAMQCLLLSGNQAFIYKIAYNEKFKKYSPGAIIDLELIKHVLDETQIEGIDSCTLPGSSFDKIFKDEKVIRSWAISNGQLSSRSVISAIPYLRKARALVRSMRPAGRV